MAAPRKPLVVTLPVPKERYDAENERQTRRAIAEAIQRLVPSEPIGGENVATEPELDALSAELDALVASLGDLAYLNAVTENEITLSDVTTDDVSTSKHGFTPKAPNDTTKFLRGDGNWAVPAGAPTSIFTWTMYTTTARALGTVYQNTSGKPMLVIMSCDGANATTVVKAVTGSTSSPATEVSASATKVGFAIYVAFWVANNDYYKVSATTGSATANLWGEYILNTGTLTASGDLGPSGANTRARTTVYQNTSGKTRFVIVVGEAGGANNTWVATSDSASSPTDVVWQTAAIIAGRVTAFAIIPNNHYYKITSSSTPTIIRWEEWDLDTFTCTKSDNLFGNTQYPKRRQTTAGTTPTTAYINKDGFDKFVAMVVGSNADSTQVVAVEHDSTTPRNNVVNHSMNSGSVASICLPLPPLYYLSSWRTAGTLTSTSWFEYLFSV